MQHVVLSDIPTLPREWDGALDEIVLAYQGSLAQREQVYRQVKQDFPTKIHCDPSCNECCYHIFLIRLLDLFLVRRRWRQAAQTLQEQTTTAALSWAQQQHQVAAGLFLGEAGELREIKALEEQLPHGGVGCPFLIPGAGCSIYEDRPMLCRAHGYPELSACGEMCSTCYKNLIGVSELQLHAYMLPARRYLEVLDLQEALWEWLGLPVWDGFVLATGLVVPILMDPASIDWEALISTSSGPR